jgi:uncharacterized protein YutE (UPF0331/DUF86 family)
MSPKSKVELARQHIGTARADLDDERTGEAINALFYAAEAALDFLADKHSINTQRKHYLKAKAAQTLHKKGVLANDYSSLLNDLNDARKAVWYAGDEPDMNVEDAYADVEAFVEAAEVEA